ncbi:ABC transporter permease [Phyllobacterium sp. OV277]|uniref:ABC transporter permease n=1 Tax=Phyllobacterium sp. OV277 TaxID=1882772 RepID=UPI00088599CC|nr:ABC transporter permease [Phyllobacterium sp. OV277]SDP39447.1 ABC-2 type transport system permease protein [Phyllobacterium sp. OV277]
MTGVGSITPGFWLVFCREFAWLRRRPFLLCLTTFVPLVLMGILTLTFSAGLVTRLPIAVLDLDGTELSRQVIRTVDATPDSAIAMRVTDLAEGKHAILSGKIYGLLLLPRNLERDVFAGRRPEVVFFYNNQLMTPGSLAARGINNAVPAVEGAVKVSLRTSRGIAPEAAQQAITPIPVQMQTLFNPTQNYAHFLLASVVPAVLQIVIVLSSAYAAGLDTETTHRLRILRRLGHGLWPAMAGKILPYTLLFLGVLGVADALLFGVLELPLRGNPFLLLAAGTLFILACQFYGLVLALFFKPVASAISLATLIVSPAFGFMGIGFPRLGMNAFAYWWGATLPGTWYLTARVDQTVRGTPFDLSLHPILVLLAFVIGLALVAGVKLEFVRRETERHKRDVRAVGIGT